MSRMQTVENDTWFLTGDKIKEASVADKQRAKDKRERRDKGFDFVQRVSLKKGESKRFLILDSKIASFAIPEHEIWDKSENDGKGGFKHFTCTKDLEGSCPVCNDGHNASRVLFLSVLEILDVPYVSEKGRTHKAFKKLLAIKGAQHDAFFTFDRLIDNPENPLKTTRGLIINLARDEQPTSPRSGLPAVTDSGMIYERQLTEEQMISEYGCEEVKNKEGKVVAPENHLVIAYNYKEMFPKPTLAKIEREYGSCIPGSNQFTNSFIETIEDPYKDTSTESSNESDDGNPFDN